MGYGQTGLCQISLPIARALSAPQFWSPLQFPLLYLKRSALLCSLQNSILLTLIILQKSTFLEFLNVLNSLTTQLANYILDIRQLQKQWEYKDPVFIFEQVAHITKCLYLSRK